MINHIYRQWMESMMENTIVVNAGAHYIKMFAIILIYKI